MQGCTRALGFDRRTSYLFLGDCLDVVSMLPDKSVNCLIADPPYGIHYRSHSHTLPLDHVAHDDESAYDLLDKALAAARHKLKENSHIYIFTSWQEFAPMSDVVKRYFNLKNTLVWVKNERTGTSPKRNYSYQYEVILYAQKGRRHLSGKRDTNILYFDNVAPHHKRHPDEKPIALIEYLLAKSTDEGEIVLDMFMGTGSTCVAAQHLNRRYVGIELDPAWFALASQRLKWSVEQHGPD